MKPEQTPSSQKSIAHTKCEDLVPGTLLDSESHHRDWPAPGIWGSSANIFLTPGSRGTPTLPRSHEEKQNQFY